MFQSDAERQEAAKNIARWSKQQSPASRLGSPDCVRLDLPARTIQEFRESLRWVHCESERLLVATENARENDTLILDGARRAIHNLQHRLKHYYTRKS